MLDSQARTLYNTFNREILQFYKATSAYITFPSCVNLLSTFLELHNQGYAPIQMLSRPSGV